MMKRIINSLVAISVMAFGVCAAAMVPAQTASAASNGCTSRFLTFPAWYDGLLDNKCEIKKPANTGNGDGLSRFIWRIVLNIIEIALQVVAYASAGFIIYGGFKYLTSSGLPDKTAAAKKTIMNAIIGLVISFFSVVIVALVAGGIA